MLDEVEEAQWDREMRMKVRARASSSSFALGRAMAAPDQSTVRPFRGCTGRKFSVIGVDLLSSPKCSDENWESCKTQQSVSPSARGARGGAGLWEVLWCLTEG